MLCKSCSYGTERLIVKEWHSLSTDEWTAQDLAVVVESMLTPGVTRSLPEAWHGEYTLERAREWVQERDREGATLLVVERSSRMPVGLVILFEIDHEDDDSAEVHLGYLLAESAWGLGLASELICGLVECCRTAGVASLVGGVER